MEMLIVESESEVSDLIDEVVLNTPGLEDSTMARALTGDQATSLLMGMDFDLVIIDLQIPGFDLAASLPHFRESHPDTPVLVMSTYLPPDALKKLSDLGIHAVLFKPVEPEDIQPILSGARDKIT